MAMKETQGELGERRWMGNRKRWRKGETRR
jgi:hypothetical protein